DQSDGRESRGKESESTHRTAPVRLRDGQAARAGGTDADRKVVLSNATSFRSRRDRRHGRDGQAATRLPHAAQERASGSSAVPHLAQNPVAVENRRPQAEQ